MQVRTVGNGIQDDGGDGMNGQTFESRLITSFDEFTECVSSCFLCAEDQEVYITGANMGNYFNRLMIDIDATLEMKHLFIMIPSIAAPGMLFRAQASRRGAMVRVTSRAVHDMQVGNGMVIMLSLDTQNRQKPSLIGVVSTDPKLYSQARDYMKEIWGSGHPIDI
jgi:hypothetical protein